MKRSFCTHFAAIALGLASTLGWLVGGVAAQAAPRASRPNIIYILADDQGYGDIGSYGQIKIKTPVVDEMAREGLRFTQFYAGSAVCAPSRSAFMTGQHTGHTTVRGNFGKMPDGTSVRVPLRAEDVTVAEMLHSAGYATGIIGKWGLGEPGTTGVPNAQGFDYFFGYLNQRDAHYYFPEYLWRNQEKVVLEGNQNGGRGQYSHDLFTKEALSFVERNRDRPFFLYLAYTIPHADMEVPSDSILSRFQGLYPAKEAIFAAMETRLDRDVGRILDQLKTLGLDNNTLVIYSSDNGPHQEDGHDPYFFNSNGGLRGIKRDLTEGGIRVPMIARWPGRVRPGSVTDQPFAMWDFMATAAEISGVTAPSSTDGISFLPTLLGRSQSVHKFFYWEFYEGGAKQAVRLGRWKGIRKPMLTGQIELYDLETDLREQNDVVKAHPDIERQIQAIMEKEHVPSPFAW